MAQIGDNIVGLQIGESYGDILLWNYIDSKLEVTGALGQGCFNI